LERSASCCNDHNLGAEDQSAVGLELEQAVLTFLKRGYHLIEVELRMKRLDLIEQPVGQFATGDHRHARNVVDRLLWIELGALAARAVENVDHVTFDIEKAELENRKQPAWPCANDNRVGGNHLVIHIFAPEIRLELLLGNPHAQPVKGVRDLDLAG